MQAENKKNNIKTLSFGCRLNSLESEKIQNMLFGHINTAILVNTCAVTAEAERQSGQTVRKLARENPDVPIFITGCAATRNPSLFSNIPHTFVVANRDKLRLQAYMDAMASAPCHIENPKIAVFKNSDPKLSKQFVQVQNGCNHKCAYCITRALRGPAESFEYASIVADARAAVANGFNEIVLTGVDIASYARRDADGVILISDLCRRLLDDVPQIRRLRLSSMDPASPEILKIIDLMHQEPRMMPHMHLSMQSGSDSVLRAMRRRHTAADIRNLVARANGITFSWDIICGFPGETPELFAETMQLVQETRPIRIHAFPFSPRPGTEAANMPNQIERTESKRRVKIIADAVDAIRIEFMQSQIGKKVQILAEENNIARDPHDIAVKILGAPIAPRTICDVEITGYNADGLIGTYNH